MYGLASGFVQDMGQVPLGQYLLRAGLEEVVEGAGIGRGRRERDYEIKRERERSRVMLISSHTKCVCKI